jgi:hypothetical protein
LVLGAGIVDFLVGVVGAVDFGATGDDRFAGFLKWRALREVWVVDEVVG